MTSWTWSTILCFRQNSTNGIFILPSDWSGHPAPIPTLAQPLFCPFRYDPTTGIFTVPPGEAGRYYFATQMIVAAGKKVRFELRKTCTAWEMVMVLGIKSWLLAVESLNWRKVSFLTIPSKYNPKKYQPWTFIKVVPQNVEVLPISISIM